MAVIPFTAIIICIASAISLMAATAARAGISATGQCMTGDGGGRDREVAAALKKGIIRSLKVETLKNPHGGGGGYGEVDDYTYSYCDKDLLRGIATWGYAQCGESSYGDCWSCLEAVGSYLDRNCGGGGGGFAAGPVGSCYMELGWILPE